MKYKYLVVDKYRSYIYLEDLQKFFENNKNTSRIFNTVKEARRYIKTSFFDDSDYDVFRTYDFKKFDRDLPIGWKEQIK